MVCQNCGEPTGRHPRAYFCATCACERRQRSEHEKWRRLVADPRRLAERNEDRRYDYAHLGPREKQRLRRYWLRRYAEQVNGTAAEGYDVELPKKVRARARRAE